LPADSDAALKPALEGFSVSDSAMNKSDLITRLALKHAQFMPEDVNLVVKTILNAMAMSLAQGQRIEIRGFGSFCLNRRAPRKGRNPRTGGRVMVPAKYVPRFKAGVELRLRANNWSNSHHAAATSATTPDRPTSVVPEHPTTR
jgi:integration host factor subunit beta